MSNSEEAGAAGPAEEDVAAHALLALLAQAAGTPFDPTRADLALRAAAREIAPTESRAARLRLTQAAEAIGIELVGRSLSVREALATVEATAPLALFTVTPHGTARWFFLREARDGRGRLARLEPGDDPEEWRSAGELARMFGAAGMDAVVDWQFAQPRSPAATAAAPAPTADAGDHEHERHLPPFRRLLGLLQPEGRDLRAIALFAVGVGIFSLATPVVAMAVVNTAALGTLVQQLIVLCAALFVALGMAGLLQFLQTVTVEFIQRRLFVRIAAELAYRLPRVDLRAFDRQHGPELVNRFFDVLTAQKALATLLLDGVTIALQVGIGLLLLGYYHVYLLGFDLALLAALGVLFFGLGRGGVETAVRESIAKFAVAGWMEEVARHPVAFKYAGGPQLARDRADLLTRTYLQARADHFGVLGRQLAFALALQALANVALLGLGGYLVVEGMLTLGELVAAEIVVTMVVATFTKIGKQLESYYDLLAAVEKLGHLIDIPLERSEGTPHQMRTGGAEVTAFDLAFRYDRAGREAVSHLSFRLAPGDRVALTGPNGAGKSTLIDLLFGLRRPSDGWIAIDGADLRDLRLETLRRHVAVVKGVELFEDTIEANVRMGRDDVAVADVREALAKTGLLATVMDLPDGLATPLRTGGAPLSLGQANRLMIARAIAGRPRLLILDESLDDLESEVRELVMESVGGSEARWTLLVVTHSPAVAARCDRVLRMERPGATGRDGGGAGGEGEK